MSLGPCNVLFRRRLAVVNLYPFLDEVCRKRTFGLYQEAIPERGKFFVRPNLAS